MECLDDNVASEFVSGGMLGANVTKVEAHLASCRDCRDLVAALAGGEDDSNARTHKHERLTESQAGVLPKKLTIGDRVGRYLVLSTLGTGGMGVVFSAYDPKLDRKVALKLLRANLAGTAKEARIRLQREAQAIAQLSHPNVVAVYDVGTTDDGDVYIAMEFVEGDTLTTWLKRWPRTWREILEVFHQAARGLQAAHSVGLLHRDFKPDNVLVGGDGRVRVTDFGLARSVLGPDEMPRPRPDASALSVDLTATGTVLGTPRYMPPEQLTGPDIDARSDQFSFCVALYEALYGTHPLPGATAVAMLEHGDRALPPPEGTRIPSAIARAVLRGLEKARSKRFATMAALCAELEPPPERSPVRWVAMAAAAIVLVGGATAAVVVHPDPKVVVEPRDEAEVGKLYSHIKQLEDDRKELQHKLLQKETDLRELERDKELLVAKDQEIHDLVDQMTELRAKEHQAARIKPPPSPNALITDAALTAQHDLEGCFDEWSSRQSLERLDAKVKAAPLDAGVLVRLSINTTGAASLRGLNAWDATQPTPKGAIKAPAATTGEDSPGLKFCVEVALARAKYPPSTQILDVNVDVAWAAPDLVNMSARVVGQHEAPRTIQDL